MMLLVKLVRTEWGGLVAYWIEEKEEYVINLLGFDLDLVMIVEMEGEEFQKI